MAADTASLSSTPRSALVLYGSENGNAQDLAEELGRLTERLRFFTYVTDLNSATLKQLTTHTIVLVVISTTGQGDLPINSQAFWNKLRSVRLRPGSLHQVKFTSFGLGDSSYPKFNFAHRKLYNRLIQLGAQRICDRGEADEQHPEGVDGTFVPWSTGLRQRLLEDYPLPTGLEPIPDDVLLTPKWELTLINSPDAPVHSVNEDATIGLSNSHQTNGVEHPPAADEVAGDLPPDDLIPVKDSFVATVESNKRLTPNDHWQDVRHLCLTAPPTNYTAGDVLTIYPKNFPSDVSHFLHMMGWTSVADKPLRFFSPQTNSEGAIQHAPQLPNLPSSGVVTLRELLTNYLDIMAIPRRSFFAALAHFTEDEFQRERLVEFTNPEYLDELYDYTTRPRRSVLEVLQEFETIKFPWKWICSILPPLRGRQFSIASGGELKGDDKQTRIELLIAIVKYRTVIKRIRQGVCTRYIASLQPGQKMSVTLQRGGLGVTKEDLQKPVVMVGPGTGVAPMRSLTFERKAWGKEVDAKAANSPDLLFFGCRNADSDYFFRDEWESLADLGRLELFPAFSRDQRQKVYVQDLVRKEAKRVYEALHVMNGFVYICGSSGKMPQAVREALIEVFQNEGAVSREDAESYFITMEKNGRYKQETW